jgi:hypothetical protein
MKVQKYQHQRNKNTNKMTGNKMMNVRENVYCKITDDNRTS